MGEAHGTITPLDAGLHKLRHYADLYSTLKNQNAVAGYLKSEQSPPFGFAWQ